MNGYDGPIPPVTEGPYTYGGVAEQKPVTEVRTVSSTGGEKGMKPARFDLIPTRPLWLVAEVYGKGAEKYADRNWERGYEWSKSYAALQRHVNQFWSGEDTDEDGLPHLAHAVFHLLAMLEWGETHPEFDDRPGGRNAKLRDLENATWQELLKAAPLWTVKEEVDA